MKNLLLLLLTLVLIFISFEAALRLFKPQIFEIHPRGMYVNNDFVGYILKPGFEGYIEREEFKTLVKINDKSFRGHPFHQKDNSSYRILILGDSFTFGFGVEEENTFAWQLAESLRKANRKVEVLNAGVPGYGTQDELNFLKLIGKEVKPDLVILQFLPDNDFEENRSPAVEWADVKDGWLKVKQVETSTDTNNNSHAGTEFSLNNILYWLKANLHSIKFVSERLGFLSMKLGIFGNSDELWGESFSKEDEDKTTLIFRELKEYATSLNAEFLLLYSVGQRQVISGENKITASEKFIYNVTQKENIMWINSLDQMRKDKKKEEFYYPIDGHWTAKGHKFIAQLLDAYLTDNLAKIRKVK